MPYAYPYDDLDRVNILKSLPGSFWRRVFVGQQDLEALLIGRAELAKMTQQTASDMLDCLSRVTAPVGKDVRQLPLVIDPTQRQATSFAGGATYPLPSDILTLPILVQDVLAGGNALVCGVDYYITPGVSITFLVDPLANQDGTLTLFGWHGTRDANYAYTHGGYLTGVQAASSNNYSLFVNALLDAAYNGPSSSKLRIALQAITGAPLALTNETVQVVTSDNNYQLVITDHNTYRVSPAATVVVQAGQTLVPYQQLCDTVRVLTPGRDLLPADVTNIILPANSVDPSIGSQLTFTSLLVGLTVTLSVSGFTKVSWSMPDAGGTAFFNLLHTRGVAAGKTLANYLDTRPQPAIGQPTSANLPSFVSPALLLWNNVLRNSATCVIIKTAAIQTDALGINYLPFLRNLISPENLLVTVLQ